MRYKLKNLMQVKKSSFFQNKNIASPISPYHKVCLKIMVHVLAMLQLKRLYMGKLTPIQIKVRSVMRIFILGIYKNCHLERTTAI